MNVSSRKQTNEASSMRFHIRTAQLVLAGATLLVFPGQALSQSAASAPTFSKDVAPILQQKCQACHQPNGMAPMPLMTYEQARPWARSMRTKVVAREMPPWDIDRTVGIQKFKNDISLSDAQVDIIARWADGGALSAFESAYAHYDLRDAARALWETVDLFEGLEKETARRLGIDPLLDRAELRRQLYAIVRDPRRRATL